MPGGDRTGPQGGGPRTGRAMGFCSGSGQPGYMSPGPGGGMGWGGGWGRGFGRGGGRGMAWGFGRGRGWGRGAAWGYPVGPAYGPSDEGGMPVGSSPEDERRYLKEEAKSLERHLDALRKRLASLESSESKET